MVIHAKIVFIKPFSQDKRLDENNSRFDVSDKRFDELFKRCVHIQLIKYDRKLLISFPQSFSYWINIPAEKFICQALEEIHMVIAKLEYFHFIMISNMKALQL